MMSQENDPKIGSTVGYIEDQPPINYFEDEGEQKPPHEPATLERIVKLADESKELQRQIEDATVALAKLQADYDRIINGLLPGVMEELGLEEFKMQDGRKVEIKSDIKCSITEERKPAAWAWLEETQNDGIIKTAVSAAFGRGEMDEAKKAQAALEAIGVLASIDRSVHPSTLKSFVKEQLEKGTNIPLDTFGVFDRKIAKITLPKARK
jgi:hypothetical protein